MSLGSGSQKLDRVLFSIIGALALSRLNLGALR